MAGTPSLGRGAYGRCVAEPGGSPCESGDIGEQPFVDVAVAIHQRRDRQLIEGDEHDRGGILQRHIGRRDLLSEHQAGSGGGEEEQPATARGSGVAIRTTLRKASLRRKRAVAPAARRAAAATRARWGRATRRGSGAVTRTSPSAPRTMWCEGASGRRTHAVDQYHDAREEQGRPSVSTRTSEMMSTRRGPHEEELHVAPQEIGEAERAQD